MSQINKFGSEEERQAAIRQRAYELWQLEGHPHGRDLAHWTMAEQEIDRTGIRLTSNSGQKKSQKARKTAKVK